MGIAPRNGGEASLRLLSLLLVGLSHFHSLLLDGVYAHQFLALAGQSLTRS